MDTQQLLATLPLAGTDLLNRDGTTKVTVNFANGTTALAKVADSPKATATALSAVVAVPVAYKYTGTGITVTVTTEAGTSASVSYVLETPEQTIKRLITEPVNQTTVIDALHASETPQEAIDRISGSLHDKDRKLLVESFQTALKQGFRLSTPNVKNNVSVHAVMLPFEGGPKSVESW